MSLPSDAPSVQIVQARELPAVAAAVLAARLSEAIVARGTAVLALSGGRGPAPMFRSLSSAAVPWDRVSIVQVDERVAPDGHEDRNLTLIHEELIARIDGTRPVVHPMPVTEPDLAGSGSAYAATLEDLAGRPPVLDVVHLGIGDDGHTASLVPGDPVLEVRDRWVDVTAAYAGYRRMTMTYPVLDGARAVVLMVGGASKSDALRRMLAGDPGTPAARVRPRDLTVIADEEAASGL